MDSLFVWVSFLFTSHVLNDAPDIIYKGAIGSVTLSLIYYAIRIMSAIRSHDLNIMKLEEQKLKNEIAKKELENLNNNQNDNEITIES